MHIIYSKFSTYHSSTAATHVSAPPGGVVEVEECLLSLRHVYTKNPSLGGAALCMLNDRLAAKADDFAANPLDRYAVCRNVFCTRMIFWPTIFLAAHHAMNINATSQSCFPIIFNNHSNKHASESSGI